MAAAAHAAAAAGIAENVPHNGDMRPVGTSLYSVSMADDSAIGPAEDEPYHLGSSLNCRTAAPVRREPVLSQYA